MELPVLDGIIDRRILINYRIKSEVVKLLLPPHLDPLVINGYASGGICLLRLKNIGVKHSPSFLRINSENAAHRFLVTFTRRGQLHKGVFIPRRDTDSLLNVLLGGKMFSWPHYSAAFEVEEETGRYAVSLRSKDGKIELETVSQLTTDFPTNSMFDSIGQASSCFENCPTGISPSTRAKKFKSIQLKTKTWDVKPLQVHSLKSSFFDNRSLFPHGTIEFDNALLMEGIEHEWIIDGG